MKIIILLTGILLFTFLACYTYRQKSVEKSEEEIIISYSRGSCFGKCPVFEFIILKNGNAVYTGEENVENIGVFFAKIDSVQLNEIKDDFATARFADLEEEYLSNIKDLPIIEIFYAEKSCTFHSRLAPSELKELTKKIDEKISRLNWKQEK